MKNMPDGWVKIPREFKAVLGDLVINKNVGDWFYAFTYKDKATIAPIGMMKEWDECDVYRKINGSKPSERHKLPLNKYHSEQLPLP